MYSTQACVLCIQVCCCRLQFLTAFLHLCVCVYVCVDPSPMMPVDPVRVLSSPGQLEQEYRTELMKV